MDRCEVPASRDIRRLPSASHKEGGPESPPTHKHLQCLALGAECFSTALDQLRDCLKKEIERFPDLRWEGHWMQLQKKPGPEGHQLSGASQLTTGHQVARSFQVDGFLGVLANDF